MDTSLWYGKNKYKSFAATQDGLIKMPLMMIRLPRQ